MDHAERVGQDLGALGVHLVAEGGKIEVPDVAGSRQKQIRVRQAYFKMN